MATWKALALVHDTREEDLRPKLVESLDCLDEIAAALTCEPYEEEILEAIAELQKELETERSSASDVESNASQASYKLEEAEAREAGLQSEVQSLREQLEAARAGAAVTIAALKGSDTIPAPLPVASFPKLSANLKKALALAATNNGLGSWDVGAGTLGALKKRGLVQKCADGRYCLTDAGREALNA